MDLSAIIDEFNRRKAQAGQRIGDMFTLPKKPDNWFEQMQQGQNAVINPQQRDNINRELADMVERFAQGVVPEPIRARDRAMQTDPSAAAKPFTSEEVKGITPFVTAAAPIAYHGTPHEWVAPGKTMYHGGAEFDPNKVGTFLTEQKPYAEKFASQFQGGKVTEVKLTPGAKIYPDAFNWQDYQNIFRKDQMFKGYDAVKVIEPTGEQSLAIMNPKVIQSGPRPDMSKIGTGQGAQSYGHGLYFAENPNVAASYQSQLSEGKDYALTVGQKTGNLPSWLARQIQSEGKPGLDKAIKDWEGRIEEFKGDLKSSNAPWLAQERINNLTPQLDLLKEAKKAGQYDIRGGGATYQVNIPDQHAARMLDWDKPLSEQPEIEKLLPSLGFKQTVEGHWQGPQGGPISRTNPMGGEMVVSAVGNSERGSRLLQQAGIPGIKYLDQGSRVDPEAVAQAKALIERTDKYMAQVFPKGAPQTGQTEAYDRAKRLLSGEGQTRNFVVFDPAILQDVTRK